jgi:hypothetical protein
MAVDVPFTLVSKRFVQVYVLILYSYSRGHKVAYLLAGGCLTKVNTIDHTKE